MKPGDPGYIYSYVTWLPGNSKHPPFFTDSLKEALDKFTYWVICSHDKVTVSQQWADGTYNHIAQFYQKGVDHIP